MNNNVLNILNSNVNNILNRLNNNINNRLNNNILKIILELINLWLIIERINDHRKRIRTRIKDVKII